MAQLKFGSAGVSTREIDLSGPVTTQPTGVPAGIIGTAKNGPAFVPVTVGNLSDWYSKFGETDGKKFGPLAVVEWLRYARSVSYLRVLGVGDGKKRNEETGEVRYAGFVVGEDQPNETGALTHNPYANTSYSSPGSPATAGVGSVTTSILPIVANSADLNKGFTYKSKDGTKTAFILIDHTVPAGATTTPDNFTGNSWRVYIGTSGGMSGTTFASSIRTAVNAINTAASFGVTAVVSTFTVTLTHTVAGTVTDAVIGDFGGTLSAALTLNDFTGDADAVAPTVVYGPPGRTYFLGCFMSESAGSTIFSSAGLQGTNSPAPDKYSSAPIIRGVVMAASGVVLRLSSSITSENEIPSSTAVADEDGGKGSLVGDVILRQNNILKQDFTLLLNGHKGTDVSYPNYLTASFDPLSNNYFANVLNTDPLKLQESGHYLYAHWDIHPSLATVTGSGLLLNSAAASQSALTAIETIAFLATSSLSRNVSSTTVPNYESFTDRFSHAKTPWFMSQRFGGKPADLFRLHALDAGAGPSSQFKVSIENIVPSTDPLNKYGSFNVVLREWNDTDRSKKPIPNETFAGVNLDPSSDRYIGKVIGDLHSYFDFDREESSQKIVVEGNYENRSNYVRVEVHPDVENGFVDPIALPVGFRGVDHLVTSGSAPLTSLTAQQSSRYVEDIGHLFLKNAVTPPLPFREKITINNRWDTKESADSQLYWGVQFEHPENLSKQNASTLPNKSLNAFAKYYPGFSTAAKFVTGSNSGQTDSAAFGIIDSDKFCNNSFSLENIQVVTNSAGIADPTKWKFAVYSRNQKAGEIYASEIANIDPNITSEMLRGLTINDFSANKTFIKFTTMLQGGFDGVNIFDSDESEINNNAVHADMMAENSVRGLNNGPNVKSYLKALDIMKNTVNLDIQLLAIPGIREPIVTDAATLAVQDRFDALYIMDIEQQDENAEYVSDSDDQKISVSNTLDTFKNRSTDSSFAAAYFPDVLYRDPIGINLKAPPSVVVLGALALNDFVGHPWFAPAGYTRGALPDVALEADVHLSKNDMDQLYDNRVNPIVSFGSNTAARSGTNPRGGLVVWGQKTLQVAASALDRVNVRRLLIEIRRQVRDVAQRILFEPNREATLARFSAAVTPNLQRIQALSGLERFKVIIDSSTTTQDDIENNTIRGKIFVQPTKSIEFVSLDFVVANNLQQVG